LQNVLQEGLERSTQPDTQEHEPRSPISDAVRFDLKSNRTRALERHASN
jgi:hypothetical protein